MFVFLYLVRRNTFCRSLLKLIFRLSLRTTMNTGVFVWLFYYMFSVSMNLLAHTVNYRGPETCLQNKCIRSMKRQILFSEDWRRSWSKRQHHYLNDRYVNSIFGWRHSIAISLKICQTKLMEEEAFLISTNINKTQIIYLSSHVLPCRHYPENLE